MDYILTSILIILGVGFHVMQKIRILRTKFPEFSPKKIIATFFTEEWDSLIVSFLVWLVYELGIFIPTYNGVKFPFWWEMIGVYVAALVLGYCGQRVAYKYLGTAEEVLEKKADDLKKFGATTKVDPNNP